MSESSGEQTEPCRYCGGTGRVVVARCAEIVAGRRCRWPARRDPSYYDAFPDRGWMRPYCSLHGNMRLRASARDDDPLD